MATARGFISNFKLKAMFARVAAPGPCTKRFLAVITSAKGGGGDVLVFSVCLFVCLSVRRFTYRVIDGFA